MSGKPPRDARLLAVDLLSEVLDQRQALSELKLSAPGLDERDEAFARRLAYGVLRQWLALKWLADRLLSKPLRERDRDIERLLLLGLYQLWLEDTPGHAAVHATAECARGLGKTWAVGLVNAVLRRFQREQEQWLEALRQCDEQHAHPAWLLQALRHDWPDQWPAVVAANNRQAPLWLRCNRTRTDLETLDQQLRSAGFSTRREPSAPDALAVEPAAPVQRLPGFNEGLCSVQDAAAQLAAGLMQLEPGQRVLDACAAPGGKTCHLLERQPGLDLVAVELVASRLELMRENLHRLGLQASLVCADAASTEQWWDGNCFDRILLDAPCSATGVIRRHPEIKWLRTPQQLQSVHATQQRLLQRLWPLLKPGGMLVYATCSVLKSENSQQIQQFLDTHGDSACIDPAAVPGLAEPCGRQILPGQHDMDGFFYAVLVKSA